MKTCWQHRGEYYIPYRSVKARIELFKAGRRNIGDDLHGVRPPAAVSEEAVEEVGHLVINELQCRSEPSQRKCRYTILDDAPAETILFWHINMFCVLLKTDTQMPNPEQGQICMETSSDVLDLLRRFAYLIFDPGRDTGSSLGPREQERVALLEPPSATSAKEEKVVKSAGKVMVTVFWDTARLLRVDFLDYGINMNE